MISNKIKEELDEIIQIAKKQDYKINSITFYNIFAALPSGDKTDEVLNEMEGYMIENNVSIVSDGVEIEVENEKKPASEKIRPFDPSKIDISMQPITMDSLTKRIKNKEINLNTDFQRKSGLWSGTQKSQLVESLLLKIPLPAFYFDAEMEDKWLIIDGLQRITALKEFIIDQSLKLSGLEFFCDLEGLTYDQLPRAFVRRIEETNLIAYTVKKGTPVNVKYNIFKRINTGGLELTSQEIRHALYQGQATKMIKKLAQVKEFKEATEFSIRTERMMDQEFVLRFIAVCFFGVEKYEGLPEDFLNNAMGYINQVDENKLKMFEDSFIHIMNLARKIFGRYAFRKMSGDGWKRPINKAVYEAWCKNLLDLEKNQQNLLCNRKNLVQEKFIQLCDDNIFINYLKASDKRSYQQRIKMIKDLIGGVINGQ